MKENTEKIKHEFSWLFDSVFVAVFCLLGVKSGRLPVDGRVIVCCSDCYFILYCIFFLVLEGGKDFFHEAN